MRLILLISLCISFSLKSFSQVKDFMAGYRLTGADIAFQEGDYEKAILLYTKVINQAPEYAAEAYTGRGAARLNLFQYESAIDDCQRALQIQPENATAYYNLGVAKTSLFRFEEGIRDLKQAARINPDAAIIYCNIAMAYLMHEQFGEAIKVIGKAIELEPNVAIYHMYEGRIHTKLGLYSHAIESFNHALDIDAEQFETLSLRGVAYAYEEKYTQAFADIEQAHQEHAAYIEQQERWGNTYSQKDFGLALLAKYKGEILFLSGNYQKALIHFDEAIAQNMTYSRSNELLELIYMYEIRGQTQVKLKNYQAAISDYDMAILLHSNPPSSFYTHRAHANKMLNRTESAINDLAIALEKEPENFILQQELMELVEPRVGPKLNSGQSRTHIVSVGINNYRHSQIMSSLNYPVDQVREFERYVEEAGFVQDAVVLTNSEADFHSIKESLISTFCDASAVGSEDLVIFYYSGHGVATGDQIGICPYDYFDQGQLISDADILEILHKSPAKHKVVIIEACKSEAKTPMGSTPSLSQSQIQQFNSSRNQISGGIVYISSTEPGQDSFELTNFGGIFSQYFLRGIKGAADKDGNQIIHTKELFDYLKIEVEKKSQGLQIPQINEEGHRLNIPLFIVD